MTPEEEVIMGESKNLLSRLYKAYVMVRRNANDRNADFDRIALDVWMGREAWRQFQREARDDFRKNGPVGYDAGADKFTVFGMRIAKDEGAAPDIITVAANGTPIYRIHIDHENLDAVLINQDIERRAIGFLRSLSHGPMKTRGVIKFAIPAKISMQEITDEPEATIPIETITSTELEELGLISVTKNEIEQCWEIALTMAGRDALNRWLSTPDDARPQTEGER